jgi:predicted phage terminase large subunit-like protein
MRSSADLAVLETIAAEQAGRDFWAFRQFMAPGMLHGWWQRDAARHLQEFRDDLYAGKRPKLIIQAPPQHGKSETIVDFIAWLSGLDPDMRTIYASFSEMLGTKANFRLQRIFETDRFARAFPELRLSGMNAGTNENGQTLRNRDIVEFVGRRGYFRATTVRGSVTGEGLDLAVLDDPIKSREEANSETVRARTWEWLTDDFLTRFSNKAGLLCILTRWHLDDPAGRLIASDPTVKVLAYPAIAEDVDGRSPVDRENRSPGEALFPQLKPIDFLQGQRRNMDPWSWEALYQQNPTVAGGNLFKIDQFKRHSVGEERAYQRRMIFADTAQKTGQENDYSVFQCWGLGKDGVAYLIDQARGKFEAPDLEKVARAFWAKHQQATSGMSGHLITMAVEDKVSGTGLIQQLGRGEGAIPVRAIKRARDKYSRALDVLPSVAAGLVSLPCDAPWTKDLMAELSAFPGGKNDDQVDPLLDAVSQLLLTCVARYNLAATNHALEAMLEGGGGTHAFWRERYGGR